MVLPILVSKLTVAKYFIVLNKFRWYVTRKILTKVISLHQNMMCTRLVKKLFCNYIEERIEERYGQFNNAKYKFVNICGLELDSRVKKY